MFQITLVDNNYITALPIACTLCSIYQPTQFAHGLEIIFGSKDFWITLYIWVYIHMHALSFQTTPKRVMVAQ